MPKQTRPGGLSPDTAMAGLVASRCGSGGFHSDTLLLPAGLRRKPPTVPRFRLGLAHPNGRGDPGGSGISAHRSVLVFARRRAVVRLGVGRRPKHGNRAPAGRTVGRGAVVRGGDRGGHLALVPVALGGGRQLLHRLPAGFPDAVDGQSALAGAPARGGLAVSAGRDSVPGNAGGPGQAAPAGAGDRCFSARCGRISTPASSWPRFWR